MYTTCRLQVCKVIVKLICVLDALAVLREATVDGVGKKSRLYIVLNCSKNNNQ